MRRSSSWLSRASSVRAPLTICVARAAKSAWPVSSSTSGAARLSTSCTISNAPGLVRGVAGVVPRRQREQALLFLLRQLDALDEALQRLLADFLAPRVALELLVGLRQAVAAHHGL